MDLCALIDDPFRVICHYLANQVFTFDSGYIGKLRAGQMLDSIDLQIVAGHARKRKALLREICNAPGYKGSYARDVHQAALLNALRASLRGMVCLATTSKTMMHRILWRSIYFELAPLVSAAIIWRVPELGIPTYHMIADDALISPIYFYLSVVRTIGGNRSRRYDDPQCITTHTRDAMTREMQQLIVKARKDDAAARDPRRSARKRCLTAREDDEPARKRQKR